MWPKRGTFGGNTGGSLWSYRGAKRLKEKNATAAMMTNGVTGATIQMSESGKVLLMCTISGKKKLLNEKGGIGGGTIHREERIEPTTEHFNKNIN